ncbi:hypothetical protein RMATCC62417_06418 [Rhizopus microsporus]|nr:hypothetical protein RMATCC62417_06418 [Rhizopus microsporus]
MILNDIIITSSEDTAAPTSSNYSYGRKVSVLIQTAYEKDAFDISANEWKRTGSSQQIVLKQQVKNMLSNASILCGIIKKITGISSIPAINFVMQT